MAGATMTRQACRCSSHVVREVSSIRVSYEDTEKHRDTHSELRDNFGHRFEGIACGGERMVANEENGTQRQLLSFLVAKQTLSRD
jgi:hypothetical protein